MAKLAGYSPGKVILQLVNAHLYESHFPALEEQLTNKPYDPPKLIMGSSIKRTAIKDIPGVFSRIKPEDIFLENYKSHKSIKAPMAV